MQRIAFVLLLLAAACGEPSAPAPIQSVSQASLEQQARDEANKPEEPNRFYAQQDDIGTYDRPDGRRNGSLDRGDSFIATDRDEGWIRTNPLNARIQEWVKVSVVGPRPPPAVPQPLLTDAQRDIRIQGVPLAGESATSAEDVVAIRTAGAQLLSNCECQSIETGAGTTSDDVDYPRIIPKTYFLTCRTGPDAFSVHNVFFTTRRGQLERCGTELPDCDTRH